jgi:hypothetical protein
LMLSACYYSPLMIIEIIETKEVRDNNSEKES